MKNASSRNRHPFASYLDAGSAALPYGFAISGLVLGVGAIVVNTPVVGTCGAVAGVTAGLLSQFRARQYRSQSVALRERLRGQRAQADAATVELRSRVSALEIAIWEVQTLTAAPVVQAPAVPAPVVQAPVVQAPVVQAPVVQAPDGEAPVVQAPVVEAAAVVAPVVPAYAVQAQAAGGRPGLRLAQAAARITVPKTVLDAAVATTGGMSLADIAEAAQRKGSAKQSPVTAKVA